MGEAVVWVIGVKVGAGLIETLGTGDGLTFYEACRNLAHDDQVFRAGFDAARMLYQGDPVVPVEGKASYKPLKGFGRFAMNRSVDDYQRLLSFGRAPRLAS